MSTIPAGQNVQTLASPRRPSAWSYYVYCEILKMVRNPPVIIFGVCFPTVFFLFFGAEIGAKYSAAILASFASYAAFVVPFSALSNTLAAERAMGWHKLLRTTPLSIALNFGARILTIILIGVVSMLVLFAVALLTGKVSLDAATLFRLLLVMTLGMLPFIAMGLFLGFIASATAAQAISTVCFLLLSFTSGLFIPIQFLPQSIAQIAPYLPTYHLGQIGWSTVGRNFSDNQPLWVHFLWLALYTILFLLLAVWAYRRDENKNFS